MYLIAEIGNNHEGSLETAFELIEAAKRAGADAAKFQMFRADTLVHGDAPALVGEGTQRDRMRKLEFDGGQWRQIIDRCRKVGIDFAASVFDVALFETWHKEMAFYKIASGDFDNLALQDLMRMYGPTPIFASVGCASLNDVTMLCQRMPRERLTILHCVSEYPTPDEHAGLGRIAELRQQHSRVGYSDHTRGITACVAAAALGAEVIEKHFCLRDQADNDYGDFRHSANPEQFADLAEEVVRVANMLQPWYHAPSNAALLRGTYARKAIKSGEFFTRDNLIALRPRAGRQIEALIGRKATQDYEPNEVVR